jgi:hypothetical protein
LRELSAQLDVTPMAAAVSLDAPSASHAGREVLVLPVESQCSKWRGARAARTAAAGPYSVQGGFPVAVLCRFFGGIATRIPEDTEKARKS